ncbi:hypothetical protein [Streptomyces sp. NPDC051569]|uniref:hypothetical protein n=1 Tax=Streptomyces sp. NPDC051569 TaxID=3365661 RepID=UPI0037A7C236
MQRLVRAGITAAGLVAALTLTLGGCDGGGDTGGGSAGGSGKDKGAAGAAPGGSGGSPAADAGSGSGSGSNAAGADIEGTWTGRTDGKAVALSVKSGKVALVADQSICQGSVQDMGEPMLTLTCEDGATDRAMGTIESNDGKTLVISWGGDRKDTLAKIDLSSPSP